MGHHRSGASSLACLSQNGYGLNYPNSSNRNLMLYSFGKWGCQKNFGVKEAKESTIRTKQVDQILENHKVQHLCGMLGRPPKANHEDGPRGPVLGEPSDKPYIGRQIGLPPPPSSPTSTMHMARAVWNKAAALGLLKRRHLRTSGRTTRN
jgi:hypothetical protein